MAVSVISIFNVVSYNEMLFKSDTLLIALQFPVMLQAQWFTFHVLLRDRRREQIYKLINSRPSLLLEVHKTAEINVRI